MALALGERSGPLQFGWFAVRAGIGEALHVHLTLEPVRIVTQGAWDAVLLRDHDASAVMREAQAVARRQTRPTVGFFVEQLRWGWSLYDESGLVASAWAGSSEILGDLDRAAALLDTDRDVLEAYLTPTDDGALDGDRFRRSDPWVHADLARRLGFDYPDEPAPPDLTLHPGQAIITRDGVMRVVKVEGLVAQIASKPNARNTSALELELVSTWRRAIRADDIPLLDGRLAERPSKPMFREQRMRLAATLKDRLFPIDDLVLLLTHYVVAKANGEWLSPVEQKNREAARRQLATEVAASTDRDVVAIEEDYRGRGL